MDTAHKSDKQKKEYFDDEQVLDKKVTELAEMIRKAKHFTIFTGAGISTSTGIPDFRSGKDTVLQTGPGVWEKKALKIKDSTKHKSVSSLKAIPSKTHMAIVQLQKYGILKFLISQNTDGLHRRSGFDPECLAELHGNTNLEKCKKCGKKYMRDFRTRTAKKVHDHKTGRQCDDSKCKGDLYDSIINFGENLPEKDMDNGFTHAQFSDLCLALGSSLTVTPAADMPAHVGKNGKLFIVNLQETPLDSIATRINGLCDKVMELLMKKLDIPIPEFTLNRRLRVSKNSKNQVLVEGVDQDNGPYSLFRQVNLVQGKETVGKTKNTGPFLFQLDQNLQDDSDLKITLGFMKHYNETDYELKMKLKDLNGNKTVYYSLQFDVYKKIWLNCDEYDPKKF